MKAAGKTTRKRRPAPPRRLTAEERRLYEAIPEDVACVHDASFDAPGAEGRYFGPDRRRIPVPGFTLLPEVPEEVPPARSVRLSLSAEDERILFLRYNYAKHRLQRLRPQQRRRFAAGRARRMIDWHRRALRLRGQIARANLPLVPTMAKRVRIDTVEFSELISEGYLAVLRCIEKFDASRGFKFSTYACRAILKSFHRTAAKAGRYRQHVSVEFDPKLERSDYAENRRRRERAESIEAVREVLRRNVADLSDVERTVIQERFAIFNGGTPRTLSEIGAMVSLTNEGVRQIQKRALVKIEAAITSHFAA